MQLEIPNAEDIRKLVREEIANFFSNFEFGRPANDIGRGAKFASSITGKAVPTIYALVNANEIPHSKRGKDLYFSRKELEAWMLSNKRMTNEEASVAATGRTA